MPPMTAPRAGVAFALLPRITMLTMITPGIRDGALPRSLRGKMMRAWCAAVGVYAKADKRAICSRAMNSDVILTESIIAEYLISSLITTEKMTSDGHYYAR